MPDAVMPMVVMSSSWWREIRTGCSAGSTGCELLFRSYFRSSKLSSRTSNRIRIRSDTRRVHRRCRRYRIPFRQEEHTTDLRHSKTTATRQQTGEPHMTDTPSTQRDRGERPQTRRRKSLSDKQMAILEVIQRSIARYGYPPSMREIGDAVGLKSLSSVTHQLNQLELSGYLRRDAGKTRAMEVLIDIPGIASENPADTAPAVGDAALVPLVGRIAAGVPITAEQQVEEIFPLPRQLVGKGELFMLKVAGE